MNPVLYDFKRAFIRPATIIALVVFILMGIGLSYLVSILLGTSVGAVYPMFLAKLDVETGEFTIYYSIYDSEVKPTTAYVEVSLFLHEQEIAQAVKTFTFSANGYHVFKTTLESNVLKSLPEKPLYIQVSSSTPLGFMRIAKIFVSLGDKMLFASYGGIYFPGGGDGGSILAVGGVFLKNGELIISLLSELPSEGFKLYYVISPRLREAGFDGAVLAGDVSTGLNVFRINVSELGVNITDMTEILLYLKDPEGVTYSSTPGFITKLQTGAIQRRITNVATGRAGLGLFSQFFPIVVLYLAYALVAKPKGMGALEFLIARPVTRFEVYTTRFVAGALTALMSTVVFFAAFNASMYWLIGYTIETPYVITLFLGVTGSLIAFYSVCYMLSTVISGTRYLAASIFLYLLFTMIMDLVIYFIARLTYGFTPQLVEELPRLQYSSYYFNPLGLTSFATYFVNRALFPESTPEVSIVNPYLVVVAAAAWILGPFILGWLLFKKANLSS